MSCLDKTLSDIKKSQAYKSIPRGYNKSSLKKDELCELISSMKGGKRKAKSSPKKSPRTRSPSPKPKSQRTASPKKKPASKTPKKSPKKTVPVKSTPKPVPMKSTKEQGRLPPSWDVEKNFPIPEFLKQYKYVLSTGTTPKEIIRFFILPDSFVLDAYHYGKDGHPEKKPKPITVKKYHDWVDNDRPRGANGLAFVTLPGLKHGIDNPNKIAPRENSEEWNEEFSSRSISNEAAKTPEEWYGPLEIRKNGRILSTLRFD